MIQEDNKLEIKIFAKGIITSQTKTKTKTRECKLEEKQYEPYSKVTLYIFMHTVCEVFFLPF